MKHFVEIHAPGGATERHEILGAEALIGSGVASSIRPTRTDLLQAEHLRLIPSDTGCRVSLMPGVAGPIMHGGAPQWEVAVPWGDEVFVAGIRFTFLREHGSSKRPSPVLLAVAAVVLVLAAIAFVRSSDEQGATKREPEPPALLEKSAACSERNPSRVGTVAMQAEHSALAKEERFAFSVEDGAQALALLSNSEACYRAAGKTEDAERLKAELVRWSAQIDEDYAGTRLRLRMALEHDRWGEALEAVQHLETLLVDRGKEPYREWLGGLRQDLERKIATKSQ